MLSLLALFLAACVSISVYVHWAKKNQSQYTYLANKADSDSYNVCLGAISALKSYKNNKHGSCGQPCWNWAQRFYQLSLFPCTVTSFTFDAKSLRRWMSLVFLLSSLICSFSLTHTCPGVKTKIRAHSFPLFTPYDSVYSIQIYSCQTLWNRSLDSSLYMTVCVRLLVSGCYVPGSTLTSTTGFVSEHLKCVQIVAVYTKQIQRTRANSVFISPSKMSHIWRTLWCSCSVAAAILCVQKVLHVFLPARAVWFFLCFFHFITHMKQTGHVFHRFGMTALLM